jgi:aldehyde dehydrogenase family 7 protein A1
MESDLSFDQHPFLKDLGLEKENPGCYRAGKWYGTGEKLTCLNPHNNKPIAVVHQATPEDYEECIKTMEAGKRAWMLTPMPTRGDIVRQVGDALRKKKEPLGKLISLEMGKTVSEGYGEVQEFIDVCDYACGLSRTLEGRVLPSERKSHLLMEVWNPLGLIGVITAFNFPCAVLGWNWGIAAICGDLTIWKGASSTSLITVAVTKVIAEVLERNNVAASFTMVVGPGRSIGELLINDKRLQLLSFTGSTSIGKRIMSKVQEHFGKTIMELGGNNASLVMEDADLELVLKACVFASVGTAGQRCTTLRRLIIHEKVYDEVVTRLLKIYPTFKIGDPLNEGNVMGPLHTKAAVQEYLEGLEKIKSQGGKILYGGKMIDELKPGNYVYPTIVEIDPKASIIKEELFVPILYVLKFKDLEEAIQMNNSVPQGLSSSVFTKNLKNLFKWLGPTGSDCGIINCNMGPSGAEIGLAFGGEKETGCGRESGSDSWKQYMRRSSCAINFGDDLPLAQGVRFDV